jgi:competence ComEA-like helix-hairpin-helix protein
MTGFMPQFRRLYIVLIALLLGGVGLTLTTCRKPDAGAVKLKAVEALPQDADIKVYTNQNPANTFTDRYLNRSRFGDDLEQVIIAAINSASQSIDIAVQELRLPGIAKALQEKQQQGIKIRVVIENTYHKPDSAYTAAELEALPDRNRNRILEGRQLIDRDKDGQLSDDEIAQNDALIMLAQAQIPLLDDTADGSKGSDLMHHKFVVIDGKRTIVTTANFTISDMVGDFGAVASRGNPNSLLDIQSPELAAAFLEEFNLLWGDGPGGRVKSRFGVKKPYRPAKAITIGNSKIHLQFSPSQASIPWEQTTNGLIASQITTAKESIDLALFVFSDQNLVNTIEPLHNNGVKTRALIDSGFIYRPYSEALDILGVTIAPDCKREAKNHPWAKPAELIGTPRLPPGDLLHHKFGVIDHKTVIVGSHNWTEAANRGNDEVLLTIENPTIAAHYQREFDRLAEGAFFGLPPAIQKKVNTQTCAPQASGVTSDGKINLNTATIEELDTLPGIGKKTAQRIIESRPVGSIEDLKKIPGIKAKTIEKITPQIEL